MRSGIMAIALGICLVFLGGCGGSDKQEFEYNLQSKQALTELAEMLKLNAAAKRKPPKVVEDLEPYEPGLPQAFVALQREEILLAWGNHLSNKPNADQTVLAYEKAAPEKGGYVLMLDGTVKELSSSEFSSASKVSATTKK